MKTLIMICALVGFAATVHAEETAGEKTKVMANDTKRAMKKGAHRTEEMVCMKSDAKCLAEKAKHRASEAGDAVSDKASEVKNKVDTEKK